MVRVSIWDCGAGVELVVDGDRLHVVSSGGTPVEKILDGITEEWTEAEIFARWLAGYEGGAEAARKNGLVVERELIARE